MLKLPQSGISVVALLLATCLTTAPALVVDPSEAPTGCPSSDANAAGADPSLLCWMTPTATRTDGAPVVTPGTKQLLNSIDYNCDNCGNKTTNKTCQITGTITQTSSLTATVESNIKAGALGIEASLKSALSAGLTLTNTITANTTVIALPKEKKVTQFAIYFENNRTATITSTYTCTATQSFLSPKTCVPATISWAGGTRTSNGNASGFSGAIEDKTFDVDCPE